MHQLAAQLKQKARALGFDLAGIAPAEQSKYRDYFQNWINSGQAGTMRWLMERFEERTNPNVYLPGAKSVICVAMNYHAKVTSSACTQGEGRGEGSSIPNPKSKIENQKTPLPEYRESELLGRVAQYALGDDYHELIKPRLHQLADWIKTQAPEVQTRCAVDTAPVMEKELAARAGIGWLGKNTCIINREIGSWLFLGEIITTLDLPPDEPAIDRCGTCRRCIDACPTQAITAPYQLDARKCISYLTIEQREAIAPDLAPKVGNWLYGCDICQEVCPWNHDAPVTTEATFQPRFDDGTIDLRELLNWRAEDYSARLKGSAMKRVKLPLLQRNAKIVLENLPKE